MTLLALGCGSGDDGSERAVEWNIDSPVDPQSNRVRLAATVEVCSVYLPLLEEPIIEYSGDRVLGAFKTITLERDLGELVLFDASTDPPEQRWPRVP